MDFKDLDNIVQFNILDCVDHEDLNTFVKNPTCENLADEFMDRLEEAFPHNLEYRLTLSEGDGGGVVTEWRQSKTKH